MIDVVHAHMQNHLKLQAVRAGNVSLVATLMSLEESDKQAQALDYNADSALHLAVRIA
jgi:hypothetical protein